MPVVDVVFADKTTIGHQRSGAYDQPQPSTTDSIPIATNGNIARTNRLKELLAGSSTFTIDALRQQQLDVKSWNAAQLLKRLERMRSSNADVETARRQLVNWDRRVTPDSPAAALYVLWEQALWRRIAEQRVPVRLIDDYLAHVGFNLSDALKESDAFLLETLASAATRAAAEPDAGRARALFQHPLAITKAARDRFNVGPFSLGGSPDTVMSFSKRSKVDIGASFRQILDPADWDRSVATQAPGQSEWTRSRHFSDLAKMWAAGEYFPLSFSDRAIHANAESTLILQPR
jgi:penicillin amidase